MEDIGNMLANLELQKDDKEEVFSIKIERKIIRKKNREEENNLLWNFHLLE